MCFSPIASFTASAVLGAIGAATLCKVKVKRDMMFAAIPLLFAVQQFIEGLLWINLLHHDWPQAQIWLIMSYGIFAFVIWPVYVPTSLFLLEADRRRKQIIAGTIAIGVCFAAYVLSVMFHTHVTARISNSCILYEYPTPPYDYLCLPMYIIATCAAFCISSHRRIRWLGIMTIITFLAAYAFYNYYLVSVWCFFAAIVSGFIYFCFHFARKQNEVYSEAI